MKNRNIDHSIHWQTPPEFYNKLNAKYDFNFDPCPLHHNLNIWDGLKIMWGKRNFINPGYELKMKNSFVLKAIEESWKGNLCVMLLPVSTSTKLFHKHILPNITQPIEFLKGRLPFIGINKHGQCVNWHLIQEVDDSTIKVYGKFDKDKPKGWYDIPKYIKGAGQHDSMLVIFDGRT